MAMLGIAIGLSPAISFDGSRAPEATPVPLPDAVSPAAGSTSLGNATPLVAVPSSPPVAPLILPPRSAMPPSPLEAFRSGTQALRQGKTEQGVMDLEYAAEQGVPGAIWKLGRMYAHGDDSAGTPNARYLANAFVALGLYHLDGIPGTLKADPSIAREMFRYAASYYADPEAQYYLGRLYLQGKGASKDAIQAARWLRLSANKGEHRAQALLGGMLFKGEDVSRQAALGLFWLIVAKDAAGPDEAWITDMYTSALAQANESERAMARKYLEDWLKNRRE
jgi:TPR repeat protein